MSSCKLLMCLQWCDRSTMVYILARMMMIRLHCLYGIRERGSLRQSPVFLVRGSAVVAGTITRVAVVEQLYRIEETDRG